MNETIEGSCLCGKVRYKACGDLRPICACHCTQCRKTSGHFSASTSVEAADLEMSGSSLKWFKSSDIAERGFCNLCGSSLFWRPFNKTKVSIYAGSIDTDHHLKLENQIRVEDKGSYYEVPDVMVVDQETLK
jgi:hypothetical protein